MTNLITFAAATDERTLMVFPTDEEAIAYCEGVDVEAGGWLFWNARGEALSPEFLTANDHGRLIVGNGRYRFDPGTR